MLFVIAIFACQRTESACEELNHNAPKGLVIATDEDRCSDLLMFSRTVDDRYGMAFSEWLDVVAAQRITMLHETILSLSERTAWTPTSFAQEPTEVPCGKGMPISDSYWKSSILSEVISKRPEQLYVSLRVSIPANVGSVATIQVLQDFDCDRILGVLELEGRFRQGISPFAGGWQLIRSSVPHLEE